MAKRVFFSFHYDPDNWRASQIRNIGVIDGSSIASDNDWESIKRGGDVAIQRWIDGQITGRSCAVVLIGSATSGRRWINYEIEKCWNDGKGVLGIHVHSLKDRFGRQSTKGANPFSNFTLKNGTVSLSSVARTYDPPYFASTDAYAYIQQNLESWIDEAIKVRTNYQ